VAPFDNILALTQGSVDKSNKFTALGFREEAERMSQVHAWEESKPTHRYTLGQENSPLVLF